VASGLGGTQPADHFALEVETRRTILNEHWQASAAAASGPPLEGFLRKLSKSSVASIRASSLSLLSKRHTQDLPVKTSYIGVQFSPLEPSPLPKPSAYYGAMSSSSRSTESTGSSSEESYRRRDRSMYRSSLGLKTLQIQSDVDEDSGEMEDIEDEDDDEGEEFEGQADESDESIDLLASLRLIDPTITAREAEFDRERGKMAKMR